MREESLVACPTRLRTGIRGLDEILGGGLFEAGVYIVMGSPGAGKTTLGNQIAFHHAKNGGRVVYTTLLSETHGRLLAFLRNMSFFEASAVGAAISYVNGYSPVEKEGLTGLMRLLRGVVRERGASLLVVDGVVTAAVSDSDIAYKKFIQELQSWVELIGCTVLLLTSRSREEEIRPEQTMVDGIIELGVRTHGPRRAREMFVSKFRGSAFLEGAHGYEITGDGLAIHPRLESASSSAAPVETEPARVGTGIARLDGMLAKGLRRNSTTLLVGPSGSGKTIMGLHFLRGGLEAGEKVSSFGFHEDPREMIETGERLGFGFEAAAKSGSFSACWQSPGERRLDALADELFSALRASGARRLLIDGLEGFRSPGEEERLEGFLSVLTHALGRMGVTTVATVQASTLEARELDFPLWGISAFAHNILLLRQEERAASLIRTLSVIKMRDGGQKSGPVPFEITDRGVRISAGGRRSGARTGVGTVRRRS